MAVPFSNTKLRVPRGFQNLLEGLAKEVLRNQPENIYNFAAIYFDNLVKIREENGANPAEIGAKHEDRFYNSKGFTKAGNMGDVSDPQQQQAATTIQAAVRGHQVRTELEATKAREEEAATRVQPTDEKPTDHGTREEEAAVRIQAAYRGYEVRKSTNTGPSLDTTVHASTAREDAAATTIQAAYRGYEARKNIVPSRDTTADASAAREDAAATTIQAAYRGYEVRRNMQHTGSFSVPSQDTTADASAAREDAAATTIQAAYRGYEVRRNMTEGGSAVESRVDAGEEPDIDVDLTDPDTQKAATKIQASFRGYQTRKTLKDKDETPAGTEPPGEATAGGTKEGAEGVPQGGEEAQEQPSAGEGEAVDIDLTDPEVEKAAVKIQGGFKMLKARKEVEELRKVKEGTEVPKEGEEEKTETEEGVTEEVTAPSPEEEVDIDLEDPEVGKAAEKIQATFRGFQTRKKLKAESEPSLDTGGPDEAAKPSESAAGVTPPERVSADGESMGHIDPNDPKNNMAASKIQAGYKGMKVRKELASLPSVKDKDSHSESLPLAAEEAPAAVSSETSHVSSSQPESGIESTHEKPQAVVRSSTVLAVLKAVYDKVEKIVTGERKEDEAEIERDGVSDEDQIPMEETTLEVESIGPTQEDTTVIDVSEEEETGVPEGPRSDASFVRGIVYDLAGGVEARDAVSSEAPKMMTESDASTVEEMVSGLAVAEADTEGDMSPGAKMQEALRDQEPEEGATIVDIPKGTTSPGLGVEAESEPEETVIDVTEFPSTIIQSKGSFVRGVISDLADEAVTIVTDEAFDVARMKEVESTRGMPEELPSAADSGRIHHEPSEGLVGVSEIKDSGVLSQTETPSQTLLRDISQLTNELVERIAGAAASPDGWEVIEEAEHIGTTETITAPVETPSDAVPGDITQLVDELVVSIDEAPEPSHDGVKLSAEAVMPKTLETPQEDAEFAQERKEEPTDVVGHEEIIQALLEEPIDAEIGELVEPSDQQGRPASTVTGEEPAGTEDIHQQMNELVESVDEARQPPLDDRETVGEDVILGAVEPQLEMEQESDQQVEEGRISQTVVRMVAAQESRPEDLSETTKTGDEFEQVLEAIQEFTAEVSKGGEGMIKSRELAEQEESPQGAVAAETEVKSVTADTDYSSISETLQEMIEELAQTVEEVVGSITVIAAGEGQQVSLDEEAVEEKKDSPVQILESAQELQGQVSQSVEEMVMKEPEDVPQESGEMIKVGVSEISEAPQTPRGEFPPALEETVDSLPVVESEVTGRSTETEAPPPDDVKRDDREPVSYLVPEEVVEYEPLGVSEALQGIVEEVSQAVEPREEAANSLSGSSQELMGEFPPALEEKSGSLLEIVESEITGGSSESEAHPPDDVKRDDQDPASGQAAEEVVKDDSVGISGALQEIVEEISQAVAPMEEDAYSLSGSAVEDGEELALPEEHTVAALSVKSIPTIETTDILDEVEDGLVDSEDQQCTEQTAEVGSKILEVLQDIMGEVSQAVDETVKGPSDIDEHQVLSQGLAESAVKDEAGLVQPLDSTDIPDVIKESKEGDAVSKDMPSVDNTQITESVATAELDAPMPDVVDSGDQQSTVDQFAVEEESAVTLEAPQVLVEEVSQEVEETVSSLPGGGIDSDVQQELHEGPADMAPESVPVTQELPTVSETTPLETIGDDAPEGEPDSEEAPHTALASHVSVTSDKAVTVDQFAVEEESAEAPQMLVEEVSQEVEETVGSLPGGGVDSDVQQELPEEPADMAAESFPVTQELPTVSLHEKTPLKTIGDDAPEGEPDSEEAPQTAPASLVTVAGDKVVVDTNGRTLGSKPASSNEQIAGGKREFEEDARNVDRETEVRGADAAELSSQGSKTEVATAEKEIDQGDEMKILAVDQENGAPAGDDRSVEETAEEVIENGDRESVDGIKGGEPDTMTEEIGDEAQDGGLENNEAQADQETPIGKVEGGDSHAGLDEQPEIQHGGPDIDENKTNPETSTDIQETEVRGTLGEEDDGIEGAAANASLSQQLEEVEASEIVPYPVLDDQTEDENVGSQSTAGEGTGGVQEGKMDADKAGTESSGEKASMEDSKGTMGSEETHNKSQCNRGNIAQDHTVESQRAQIISKTSHKPTMTAQQASSGFDSGNHTSKPPKHTPRPPKGNGLGNQKMRTRGVKTVSATVLSSHPGRSGNATLVDDHSSEHVEASKKSTGKDIIHHKESNSNSQVRRSQEVKVQEEVIDIDLEDPEVEKAALKIQSSFKGKFKKKSPGRDRDSTVSGSKTITGSGKEDEDRKIAKVKEEEIDIDLTDPEVEKAAMKIQSSFRGNFKKSDKGSSAIGRTDKKPKPQGQIDHNKETEEIDIDLEDPEVEKAALKIQSSFKGRFKKKGSSIPVAKNSTKPKVDHTESQKTKEAKERTKEEIVEIDLKDLEVKEVAPKIQSSSEGKFKKEGGVEATSFEDAPISEHVKHPGTRGNQKEAEEIDIDLGDPEVEKAALKIQSSFKGKFKKNQKKGKSAVQAPAPGTRVDKQLHVTGESEQEEEIDIDLDDPEVEKAALKIQSSFKGKFRQKAPERNVMEPGKMVDAETKGESPKDQTHAARNDPSSGVGASEIKGHTEDEEPVDIDLDDPEVQKAAVQIQAGFKGLMRRKQKKTKSGDVTEQDPAVAEEPKDEAGEVIGGETDRPTEEQTDKPPAPAGEEEEVDIDLGDPEVEQAALKIQAGFKGFKARKERKSKEGEDTDVTPTVDEGETPEAEPAEATPKSKDDTPPVAGDPTPAVQETAVVSKDTPAEIDGQGSSATTANTAGDVPPEAPEAPPTEVETPPTVGEAPPTEEEAPPTQEEAPPIEKDAPAAES